jgi:hypothetical protein
MLRVDPAGTVGFVRREDGSIYWDDNATSQATAKKGETHLGEDLEFTFNSCINSTYDGPQPPWSVEGNKQTSTIKIDATKGEDGSLQSVDVTSSVKIGATGGLAIFKGKDSFPGLGADQNKSIDLEGVSSFNATFEQHSSVPNFEALGMGVLGSNVVNVAQKLNLSLSGGELSVHASTDIFPSATLYFRETCPPIL